MSTNGKVAAEVAEQVVQQVASTKLRVDSDLLNSKDMRRARAMLKILHGDDAPDPYDLLDPQRPFEERVTMLVWCLRSRTDPTFTWEQAEEVPYGELDLGGQPPPPPGGPSEPPGPDGAEPASSGSPRKPRERTNAPS